MSNDNNRHRAIYGLATKYFIKYSRIVYKDYVGFGSRGSGVDITRLYEWPIYLYYRMTRSRAIKRSKEKDAAKSWKRLDVQIKKYSKKKFVFKKQ